MYICRIYQLNSLCYSLSHFYTIVLSILFIYVCQLALGSSSLQEHLKHYLLMQSTLCLDANKAGTNMFISILATSLIYKFIPSIISIQPSACMVYNTAIKSGLFNIQKMTFLKLLLLLNFKLEIEFSLIGILIFMCKNIWMLLMGNTTYLLVQF